MNIAQALAIAAAGYAYALCADQPFSARFATAQAQFCATLAEAEAAGHEALADTHALVRTALQQSDGLELTL
ncbi:hypothetical protein [Vitreimonas sp.]|jgi:hypothetical protein|uniref:hypothetical protein n=1 Tax=Vitreimonas sp. TaxID=3069702 RepID=UPI002ED9C3BA